MKAWLKGGFIGLFVGILLGIFTTKIPLIQPSPNVFLLTLTNTLVWAISLAVIGAIIGLIIGKFKNKNSVK